MCFCIIWICLRYVLEAQQFCLRRVRQTDLPDTCIRQIHWRWWTQFDLKNEWMDYWNWLTSLITWHCLQLDTYYTNGFVWVFSQTQWICLRQPHLSLANPFILDMFKPQQLRGLFQSQCFRQIYQTNQYHRIWVWKNSGNLSVINLCIDETLPRCKHIVCDQCSKSAPFHVSLCWNTFFCIIVTKRKNLFILL